MIVAYCAKNNFAPQLITKKNIDTIKDALWIDLICISKSEESLIAHSLHLAVPSREEMQEIEPSSRLYVEDNVLYMTATMLSQADTLEPISDAVTMIVKDDKLITLRYIEPQAFSLFIARLNKLKKGEHKAFVLAVELLEAAVDRLADITEMIGKRFDEYSQVVFRTNTRAPVKMDYDKLLQSLGANGDLNTRVWESLASFSRLNSFFSQIITHKLDSSALAKLSTVTNDISAISEQVKFLAAKVNFLLDATLGMVNIEQNNIIKIFSIAAVIFLPPTLIASIYGMNFKYMPELTWSFSYPLSLLAMLVSGFLPYKYFKKKKWI